MVMRLPIDFHWSKRRGSHQESCYWCETGSSVTSHLCLVSELVLKVEANQLLAYPTLDVTIVCILSPAL